MPFKGKPPRSLSLRDLLRNLIRYAQKTLRVLRTLGSTGLRSKKTAPQKRDCLGYYSSTADDREKKKKDKKKRESELEKMVF